MKKFDRECRGMRALQPLLAIRLRLHGERFPESIHHVNTRFVLHFVCGYDFDDETMYGSAEIVRAGGPDVLKNVERWWRDQLAARVREWRRQLRQEAA